MTFVERVHDQERSCVRERGVQNEFPILVRAFPNDVTKNAIRYDTHALTTGRIYPTRRLLQVATGPIKVGKRVVFCICSGKTIKTHQSVAPPTVRALLETTM